jgi:hypothetical protein
MKNWFRPVFDFDFLILSQSPQKHLTSWAKGITIVVSIGYNQLKIIIY